MKHRLYKYATIITLAILLSSGTVFAGSIEGEVQGLQCVLHDTVCPIDNVDPHIAFEKTFVVLLPNKKFYFLPNIDRAIMARLLAEKIKVTGEENSKHNSITVAKIEVLKDGKYRVVWTKELEDKAKWEMYNRGG